MTDKTWQSDVSNWVRHQADPSEQPKTIETVGKLLAAVAERHLRYRKWLNEHYPYFPVPLVGLVLQQMREARPDAFSPLHIVARGIRDTTDPTANGTKQFIVWLPREQPRPVSKEPKDKEQNMVWDPASQPEKHPHLFIARYVAAMVIGQAVSFAPMEIALDYYSKVTRDSWSAIIERALGENGWKVMEKYLEQVRCEPARIKPFPEIGTMDILVSDQDREKIAQGGPLVLGIDIGGTSIKIRLYKVTTDSSTGSLCWAPQVQVSSLDLRWEDLETLSETNGRKGDWPKSRENGLSDVSVLMEHLIDRAKSYFGSSSINDCKAVGISIAAPVSCGVPTAISGVLAYIQGVTNKIVEGNPLQIHQLDFAAALEKGKDWTVVCLNDGEADIRDGDTVNTASAEGVSLVLKPGTGVAFANHVDGGPLGIPAETAKAVLNLSCETQRLPFDERFQQGVLSEYCSQRAFSTLLPDGMWREIPDEAVSGKTRFPTAAEKGKWLGQGLEAALLNTGVEDQTTGVGVGLLPDVALRLAQCLETVVDLKNFFDACVEIQSGRQAAKAITVLEKEPDKAQQQQIAQDLASRPQDFSGLSPEQKFAVGCAWVLGRWLADAIALAVDLYGADEVFLAGGPLSRKTGLFVTKSAELALRDVYGLDVLSVEDPDHPGAQVFAQGVRAVGHHRQVRRLKLVYPPEESSESGPRGAAKAAFDEYLRRLKAEQMRECRDWVVHEASGQAFSPQEVFSTAKTAWEQPSGRAGSPWLLTETEVESMLSKESSSLGLTRIQDGRFTKYGLASGADPA